MVDSDNRRIKKSPQHSRIERPVQFDAARVVAKDRHTHAEARLQGFILIDEHALELGRPHRRHDLQRQVAQMAVVTLIEDEPGLGHLLVLDESCRMPGLALTGMKGLNA